MEQRKNLILIHLESISVFLLNHFAQEFPFLKTMQEQSEVFENFFSQSTSTDMVRFNWFMGSDRCYDRYSSFYPLLDEERDFSVFPNFINILQDAQYRIRGISYRNEFGRSEFNLCRWNVWPKGEKNGFFFLTNESELMSNLDEYCSEKSGCPFFLYFQNLYSHYEFGDNLRNGCVTFSETQKKRYRYVDLILKKIFKILESRQLLPNTLIAFCGDHGDDFWYHRYSTNFHVQYPYTTQIHVPFFIFEASSRMFQQHFELHANTELPQILLKKMGIDCSDFSVNNCAFSEKIGSIIFAQDYFINQPNNRCFAAISKDYLFMLSRDGLALFDWQIDPLNQNNLLSFFKIQRNGKIVFRLKRVEAVDFAIFSDEIIQNITINYEELRVHLCQYLDQKASEVPLLPQTYDYQRYLRSRKVFRAIWKEKNIIERLLEQLDYYRNRIVQQGQWCVLYKKIKKNDFRRCKK